MFTNSLLIGCSQVLVNKVLLIVVSLVLIGFHCLFDDLYFKKCERSFCRLLTGCRELIRVSQIDSASARTQLVCVVKWACVLGAMESWASLMSALESWASFGGWGCKLGIFRWLGLISWAAFGGWGW